MHEELCRAIENGDAEAAERAALSLISQAEEDSTAVSRAMKQVKKKAVTPSGRCNQLIQGTSWLDCSILPVACADHRFGARHRLFAGGRFV